MVINHVLILCDYYVSILCGVVGFSFLPFFPWPTWKTQGRLGWPGACSNSAAFASWVCVGGGARGYRCVPLPSALASISHDAFLSKVFSMVVFHCPHFLRLLASAWARQHRDRVREGGQRQKIA